MKRILDRFSLAVVASVACVVILGAVGIAAGAPGTKAKLAPTPTRTRIVSAPKPSRRASLIADRSFAILRRHIARAAASPAGFTGALAVTEGQFTARVSQESSGDVCLETENPSASSGVACEHVQAATETGIIDVSGVPGAPSRLTVLVPDGVTTVTASTATTSLHLGVTNNVATAVVHGLTEVSYRVPGGSSVNWKVGAPPPLPAAP